MNNKSENILSINKVRIQVKRSLYWDETTALAVEIHITKQIHSIAMSALLEYDRNPDNRQIMLIKIIKDHIKKRFLLGKEIEEADEKQLRIFWAMIDQVRDVFLQPELIEGIFLQK